MIKNTPQISFDQVLISFCMLISVFIGFVSAWMLFIQSSQFQKRPGINIKEL